jgi:hypothetical protein
VDNYLKRQLEILNNEILSEDFIEKSYEVIEKIEGLENSFDAVEPILILMERNPYTDFGSPGPLVHFVEKYDELEYEDKLVQSIKRHPTTHTVWMLNRLINYSNGKRKKYYLDVLQNILKLPNLDKELISDVEEYISFQNKN